MEKNLKKNVCVCVCIYIYKYIYMYIYIYIYISHFAVYVKLTQHCKSTILQLKNNKGSISSIQEVGNPNRLNQLMTIPMKKDN